MTDHEFQRQHAGHQIRETYTRGLSCHTCGVAQYPGAGPYGSPFKPNPRPIHRTTDMPDYTNEIDDLFNGLGLTDAQYELLARIALTNPIGLATACLDQAGVETVAEVLAGATAPTADEQFLCTDSVAAELRARLARNTYPVPADPPATKPAPGWHQFCGCGRRRQAIAAGITSHRPDCSERAVAP